MTSKSIISKLLIFPPLMIGAAVLWYAVVMRTPPARAPAGEVARSVRVITLAPMDVSPGLVGFGSVRPENVWTGVSQVSGRIVELNPEFRRGASLPAGTELVRISPEDFQLAIAQAEAEIRSAEASLAELGVSEQNTKELLAIEAESLALKERSVEAKRALLKRGNIAQLSFDDEMRDLLSQKKRVQDLRNSLRLIPTQKVVQSEQIRVNKSKLQTAKLDLERTVIKLPFRARIASVDVEVSQYIQVGSKIGVADGVATAEIMAQYPVVQVRAFFNALRNGMNSHERDWQRRREFFRQIGLYSIVRLKTGDRDALWRGQVVRISDSLDEQTRTIGLITRVEKPYDSAKAGVRPPLVKGMFVEVELKSKPLKGKIVVPASAIHDGKVYLAGPDDRLVIRDVVSGYSGDGFVVIEGGLKSGERLVVSDLTPAVVGMLLKAVADDDLKARIVQAASATEAVQ